VGSRTITMICAAVLALYAALLVSTNGKPGGWAWDEQGRPAYGDFAMLWGAGRVTLQGKPADAYDWDRHAAAMAEGLGRVEPPLPFHYPPYFLAVAATFAALPYLPAMLAWSFLGLAAYLLVCARIVGRWEGAVWLGASIVTFGNLVAGQNGFVTAALLGGALLALPTRPLLAGLLLGALSFKPQLGLLVPLALAAGGCWRAFGAAAATVASLALVTAGVLGIETWQAFLANVGRISGHVASDQLDIVHKLHTAFGTLVLMGVAKPVALAVQGMLAAALAGLVVIAWRSAAPHALKAAVLAVAMAMASPYVFFYDLTLLAVAQGFLLRHWLANGIEARHVYALAAVNLIAAQIMSTQRPVGFAAALLLLGLVLWEMRSHLRAQIDALRAAMSARLSPAAGR
jgi:arabinofuranan 3-O-arabinosyltransferase